jgi:bacillithiol biosynthesis cysteine-adding enzyme BshC
MSTEPIVLTESLGGSALSRAARTGQLTQWYLRTPRGVEWRVHATTVRASVSSDWYRELAPAIAARGAAAERLERAAATGVVVTTGQQACLFGGPLMTLFKAVAARALADTLQETTGLPVAPLFWAATDDADFDEASAISVSLDGGARELRVGSRAPAGTPMARMPLDPREIDALSLLLREACGSASRAAYLDSVLRAFRGGATMGDAYVEWLRDVLEPLEIAVLDSSHPAVVRAAAPTLRNAARAAEPVATAVRVRGAEIEAAAYMPQVQEVEGLSLVFVHSKGIKRRLPVYEATALRKTGEESLSATVLLRPVVERALLPTVAYLGGPAEVAYFAQVSAVADALELPAPLVLPRWSGTILEPRVQRILDQFGVGPDALSDPHALEGQIARDGLPAAISDAVTALRRHLAVDLDVLEREGKGRIPGPVLDGLRRSFEHRLQRLDRRIVAAAKRHESQAMRAIATARGSLFPNGVRQERELAAAPFLARYGAGLLDQILEAARVHARALVAGGPALASPSPIVTAPV